MKLWISSNMGKLVIGCLIFLIGVGSFVSAQEEKEEVILYAQV